MQNIPIFSTIAGTIAVFLILYVLYLIKRILGLRRVVAPYEVHIVQSEKAGRVTYGQFSREGSTHNGPMRNTYYEWPTWLPMYGVQVSKLPLTVFDQDLKGYEAYDKERVPFVIDVKAFYRIADPQLAAERISNMQELKNQLMASLQGAIRSILAEHTIEEIMQGRAEFATKFTEAVNNDLKAWGVETVKSVELMDMHDAPQHNVIGSIMAKRISGIDRESREKVAENKRAAEEAEIQARRQVELQAQDAAEQVGKRKAEVKKVTGIAEQQAEQEVAAAQKDTTVAKMEVTREQAERQAEIDRNVANIEATRDKEVAERNAERDKNVSITAAERDKTVAVTRAEAEKTVTVTAATAERERLTNIAEGQLSLATKNAEGIRATGEAEGAALKAKAMAPVEAELALQAGIGQNTEYQSFVVRQKEVEATRDIGLEQARAMGEALSKASIKVMSNIGGGASSLGAQLGALLEGMNLTDMGKSALSMIGVGEAANNGGSGVRRVKASEADAS